MPQSPTTIRVIGTHPIVPTPEQFREALEIMWGAGLLGDRLTQAEQAVREHFAGLHLLEIQIDPADAEPDWSSITQPVEGLPPEQWQVPWDEQQINEAENHWAFFFHFLDPTQPLQTQRGNVALPKPTPIPTHLSGIEYDPPG